MMNTMRGILVFPFLIPLLALAGSLGRTEWIWSDGRGHVRLFRNEFSVKERTAATVFVSADNRYVLKLDGEIIGRGPDCGVPESWTYRDYALDLEAGNHRLEAVVYHGGGMPMAQTSYGAGFMVKAQGVMDGVLSTGKGAWTAACVPSFEYGSYSGLAFGVGSPNVVKGSSPEFREIQSSGFGPVKTVRTDIGENKFSHKSSGRSLLRTILPAQLSRKFKAPGILLPIRVPANSRRRILVDLENYYTAYPFIKVGGGAGAEVRMAWSENRTKLERGDFFEDVFLPDGTGNAFTTSGLRAGSVVALSVKTASEPLCIESIGFEESRYPLEDEGGFECDLAWLGRVRNLCRRSLETCAHECVWDCPFYERLMYLGDSRIQLLSASVMTADDRLQKRCLELFAQSCAVDGIMPMNTPCNGPQSVSATYTMFYPMLLGDYVKWRSDIHWLKKQLPALCATMEGLKRFENADGLVENLPGWSFIDWADWKKGGKCPGAGPEAGRLSSIENLLYVLALDAAARVSKAAGDVDLCNLYVKRKSRCASAIRKAFWDEARGAVSDGPDHVNFSEHGQSLAILAGVLTSWQERRALDYMFHGKDVTKASVYFSYYVFEALGKMGRNDLIMDRLAMWREYMEAGRYTTPEMPEPSRSDCHGWGAHPLYMMPVHFAGIKPEGDMFSSVRIEPRPAGLKAIKAAVPSPSGLVEVDLKFNGDGVRGTVTLPQGMKGVFVWNGRETCLSGVTAVSH